MSSPYHIEGPALISFSGGRTSAYMLHEIMRAWDGKLPENVHVCFANTGKEREETLRFVHECSTRWGVRVRWLEWRDTSEGFEEVGLNSASRNGEPFDALIAKKKMPPNWQARFCTEFLKVRAMTSFAATFGWAPGDYLEVIGLRHDEGMRVLKMYARNDTDGRRCFAPLEKARVAKPDVLAFWRAQPFDLGLAQGEGNCDLCFLKPRKTRIALIKRRPSSAGWWVSKEVGTGGFFDRRDYYADLAAEAERQGDFFIDDDEYDAECGLVCAADAA